MPVELGQLSRLGETIRCNQGTGGLLLDGNALISPPDSVLQAGTPAILDYLRNQAWWHLQQLIVAIAGGIGLLAAAVLGLRYRHTNRKSKRKREEIAA